MRRSICRAAVDWFTTVAVLILGSQSMLIAQKAPDYSLGRPRIWVYQRVYPFLDGIFQDVSSTQVAPLVLNPNATNASQLNALLTSWGVGVNYSATTQAQNALAQQVNQVTAANANLQTELVGQQAQLTQQVVAATQQAGQATAALDQLKLQTNPDPTQLAAAQAQSTAANDNLNTLTAQLNAVKAQLPSATLGTQTYTAPTASQPSAVTLPTQLSQMTAPPGAPTTPNFPSSKQMDNQVNLLWERLSRLVSTIAQADNLSNYKLILAAFDVNLMPSREDKKVFAVEYSASSDGCSDSPVVVDLFPSASAVNIVNNQYKDSRGALGAVVSWFGFGLNAAYNREHLQITQALGQSAYITGFGAGRDTFGWAFGRNLGDKSVSPGKRTVFAIIAVPSSCDAVSITSTRAGWFGESSDTWYAKRGSNFKLDDQQKIGITQPMADVEQNPYITSVAYTPTEFDPTSTTPTMAALRVNFGKPIDPEMTLSLNGQIIPRARDTFARAVLNSGGSGGMLESQSYTVNTWIPTSSQSLTISLDPSKFDKRFPDVVFTTAKGIKPLSSSDLLPLLNKDGVPQGVVYVISGDSFGCVDPCDVNMPPLGYRKAPWQTLSVFHRHWGSNSEIILSLASDASNTPASTAGASNVQVLANGPSPWGGNVLVIARIQTSDKQPRLIRLPCHPLNGTMRLACSLPVALSDALDKPQTIEVHDPDHAGGPISARATLDTQPANGVFIVWSITQPRWLTTDTNGKPITPVMLVCASFMNAGTEDTFTLGYANGAPMKGNSFTFIHNDKECSQTPGMWTGALRIEVEDYFGLTDQMTIVHGSSSDPPATLLNLHAAGEPVVNYASNDYLQLYGQNLIFKKLQVGDNGTAIPLTCDIGGTSCYATPPKPVAGLSPGAAAKSAPAPAPKPAPAPGAVPKPTATPAPPAPPVKSKATPTPSLGDTEGTAPKPAPAPGAVPKPTATPAPPAPPVKSKATPTPSLGDKGGPIYMVYTTAGEHKIIVPVMKTTGGVLAAFQYVPASSSTGGAGGSVGAPATGASPSSSPGP